MARGATLASVTVSLPSLARLSPASIWHLAASTSAIEKPPAPCASTAMCLASFANGTPRARPDRVPSALSAMRSRGPAGATVMVPSGEVIFACANNHPASMVSASGTAMAKRPAAPNTEKPSARLAPEPPQSSGTHASGRPASVSACHSGAFQAPFLSLLMVCASARSAKIFSAVSATMLSLSATALNAVAESDNIVAETAEKIFADLADAQTINSDKKGAWKAPLWQALTEAGLPLAWVPEDCGGSGASLAEGFSVLGAAGRFAIAVPLAETMIAGWLLAQAKISSPDGTMTVAPASPKDRIALNADGTLTGRARGVPFAKDAKHIAVLAQGANGGLSIALVDSSKCQIEAGLNLANCLLY